MVKMQMAFDDRVHIAELVALLSPPPPEFRERCKLSYVFWDENGMAPEIACFITN